MKFRVLKMFDDLMDYTETKGGVVLHRYYPGDIFPREGKSVTAERAAELMSTANKQGVPLITPIEPLNVTTEAPQETAGEPQGGEEASQTEKSTQQAKKPLKKAPDASKKKPATPRKRAK